MNLKAPRTAKTILKTRTKLEVCHMFRFHKLVQSYSNENSVVLVYRQAYRPTGYNTEPRKKHSYMWSNDRHRRQDSSRGKGQSSRQMVLGPLNTHEEKQQVGPFPLTLHKNQLKTEQVDLNV